MNSTSERSKTIDIVKRNLGRRYGAEKRFKAYGIGALMLGLTFLSVLFASIIGNGYSAFVQSYVKLDIEFAEASIDPQGTREAAALSRANYDGLIRAALKKRFPEVKNRHDKRKLYRLVSSGAGFQLRNLVMSDPQLIGSTQSLWLIAGSELDMLMKGHIDRQAAQGDRRVDDQQLGWIDQLVADDAVEKRFNLSFFSNGDSREPELAGIGGAITGSFFTLLVTLGLSFPIGVLAALYLEEFAPTNKLTDMIEVNINNLAAVPSIVFGLLGLAMFINFFGLPRSASLVGGLVLTLMTLPTIIIASRAALKSVPPSIREAALGVGASKMQTIFHHILPLALPGMLTGTIIGMAQALGETAPLLMIGMVAFIVDIPGSVMDPSTVLPVQIFLWADSPERGFVEKTSAAIMVLLGFLIVMNALAVILRKKFERRW
jgi:phosphate transport system permease protein